MVKVASGVAWVSGSVGLNGGIRAGYAGNAHMHGALIPLSRTNT